jgi:hypothetical protein
MVEKVALTVERKSQLLTGSMSLHVIFSNLVLFHPKPVYPSKRSMPVGCIKLGYIIPVPTGEPKLSS